MLQKGGLSGSNITLHRDGEGPFIAGARCDFLCVLHGSCSSVLLTKLSNPLGPHDVFGHREVYHNGSHLCFPGARQEIGAWAVWRDQQKLLRFSSWHISNNPNFWNVLLNALQMAGIMKIFLKGNSHWHLGYEASWRQLRVAQRAFFHQLSKSALLFVRMESMSVLDENPRKERQLWKC